MTTSTHERVAVRLTHPNISDQAWDVSLADGIDTDHEGTLSAQMLESLQAAQAALDANPDWNEITLSSDLEFPSLQRGLDETED